MAKSKTRNKAVAVSFPVISENQFSGSSIIDDFDTFIEYARIKGVELSRNEVISAQDCKLLNSMLASKIIVSLSRPLPKSYPNVLNLFILFRISGMGELTVNGKKTVLKVNAELYNQWSNFNIYEKYFNLLTLYLDHFSFEVINENSFVLRLSKTNLIQEVYKKKKLEYDKQRSYYFDSFDFKCLWVMFAQFGLVDVNFFEPEEGEKTIIESIQMTDFGNVIFQFLISLYAKNDGIFYYSELYNEGVFNKIFAIAVPQLKKSFELPETNNTAGIFTFNVKLGKAQRIINIDSSANLDDLCYFILGCFDFDYDHMYMVTLKDRYGRKISYNGCPDMSFADDPTTMDVSIGELAIVPGTKMEYIYDFGDNWKFEIILDSVSPRKGNKKLKNPELVKTIGKAPKQYYWNEEEQDE